jgi:hypothetical protein
LVLAAAITIWQPALPRSMPVRPSIPYRLISTVCPDRKALALISGRMSSSVSLAARRRARGFANGGFVSVTGVYWQEMAGATLPQ